MNYKEMKYNLDIAMTCGLREAAIADLIRKRQINGEETKEWQGKRWAKCTQKTIIHYLPFLTEEMVRTSVRKLAGKGLIYAEALDACRFDHSYWFTFTAVGEKLLDDGRCM